MTLHRHRASLISLALTVGSLVPAAADSLDAAIKRGSDRVAASYLDTGMSGMNGLIDTCLVEAKRTPNTTKYAECAAIASAATKLDADGARRFGTPPLLKARAIYAKTNPAFLRSGGSETQLHRIHTMANPGL